jgi:hypothetical protein
MIKRFLIHWRRLTALEKLCLFKAVLAAIEFLIKTQGGL